MTEVGHWLVRRGWRLAGQSVYLPLLSSLAPQNPEEGTWQNNDYWVSPRGRPTFLCKQEVGKPSQNAAQPCAKAEGCVHDDLRADQLQKGWGFRIGTWNVDSLMGRAGELVEALADKGWMMIRMVGGWMFLLVPTHPGSPEQRAVRQLLLFFW